MEKLEEALIRTIIGIFIIIIIFIIGIISIFVINHSINNVRLDRFARQLFEYNLPENTILLEQHKVCGKLNGNGNGMDFLAVILIQSELELEEIKEHYNNMQIRRVREQEREFLPSIYVMNQETKMLSTPALVHRSIGFETLKDVEDFTGYFAVVIYDGGYPAWFDFRGN